MIVVSSFHPHDLDPARTAAVKHQGVELLRRFLEFAASGGKIEPGVPGGKALNGFEQDVLNALKSRGLPVHPQCETGGYRIDFALAHPDKPGRMVLAVETDGERYHKSRSARDRDRLRQAHLERLGWRFHRLWASEWLHDPERQLDAIERAWREAVAAADSEAAEPSRNDDSAADSEYVVAPESVDRTALRGPRPSIEPGRSIGEYSDAELLELCMWILHDGLQIGREQRIREAAEYLGYRRLGSVIRKRLDSAFSEAQSRIDQRGEQ